MDTDRWIKDLDLIPHPEGGHYREHYRSAIASKCSDHAPSRSACTHITFLLAQGQVSRFHCVDADEIWNLYHGRGLRLWDFDPIHDTLQAVELSIETQRFFHVIPKGHWQAGVPLGSGVLVGCTVAPGFEFQGFTLIDRAKSVRGRILERHPELEHLM